MSPSSTRREADAQQANISLNEQIYLDRFPNPSHKVLPLILILEMEKYEIVNQIMSYARECIKNTF